MKSKLFLGICVLLACVCVFNFNAYANDHVDVVVDGEVFSDCGIVVGGRVLVPIRSVFEKLGYSIMWDPNEKVVYFDGERYYIAAKLGDIFFFRLDKTNNDIIKYLPDVPQQVIDGRMYLPIRAMSEVSDADVSWDGQKRIVYINKYKSFNSDGAGNTKRNYETVDEFFEKQNKMLDDILKNIIEHDYTELEKVQAIHDYIVLNTEYDEENFSKGTVPMMDAAGDYVLTNHIGVCEGYARAAQMLLERAGIECIFVSGEAKNSAYKGSHAWNIIKVDGNYYHMDTTWDDPLGTTPDFICWTYFLKSDKTMSKNHSWNGDYPKCPNDYDFEPPFDYWGMQ